MALIAFPASAAAAADPEEGSAEDFSFERWDGHYELDLDSEDRAVAEVREEIVALFPEADQNRGIVRALPLDYEGAPAAPEDITVTDESGDAVPFEVEDEDGFRLILTGDDDFVHGEQEYHVEYTLRDVVHSPDDADIDEFSWDLIPSDRAQNITSASAEIAFSPALADALTGDSACYAGTPENSEDCTISAGEQRQDGSAQVSVGPLELPGGSGLTVGVGLDAGTVTQPQERQPSALLDIVPVVIASLAVAAGLLGGFLIYSQSRRRQRDMGTQAPEYGVPRGLSPLVAAPLGGAWRSPLPAEFVHLAVLGALVIEDDGQTHTQQKKPQDGEEPKGARKNAGQPVFRLVDPSAAPDPLDRRVLETLFPGLEPGAVFTLPKKDEKLGKELEKIVQAGPQAALERGYAEKTRHRQAALCGAIALVLIIPLAVLLIIGWDRPNGATMIAGVCGAVLAAGLGITVVLKHRVYLPAGARIRHQLDELRTVMKSAEAQRAIALAQQQHAPGSSGGSPALSAAQLAPVYDRALPFAILFGLEKKWSSVMAVTYREAGFDTVFWYPALMHSGTSSLDDTLTSMVSSLSSATSSASSSGASSTGGGAVGGGGGGGFAGGR